MSNRVETIQSEIEDRLEAVEPEVELLSCDRVASERLRLVIDRPGGVDLATCERVTGHLRDLLSDFALEISSPGAHRPLTKPDHYRRYLGRRARVRTREPRGGRRSFTGELVGATEREVTVAADGGLVSIAYSEIGRSSLMES